MMPKAYIQMTPAGFEASVDESNARMGLYHLDYDLVKFTYEPIDRLKGINPFTELAREDLVLGGVREHHLALKTLGCTLPTLPDYPAALEPWLGRTLARRAIGDVVRDLHRGGPPVFVKPVHVKQFRGMVLKTYDDYQRICHIVEGDDIVWASEDVGFVAEWRVFVHRGEIVGAKHYHGDYRQSLDWGIVYQAVAAWPDAPAAYGIDFGLTRDGRTLLVEVNDCYALGSYDLDSYVYVKMLIDRWAEIIRGERLTAESV